MAQGTTRRAVLAMPAAAGSGLAAACAAGRTQQDAPAQGAGRSPATIVYWCNLYQAGWEKVQAAATEYGKRFPNHKIEATNDSGSETDYGAKLITAFAGGSAPDVIWTTTRRIIPFQSAGGLADLTPLYTRSKLKTEQFYPLAIDEQSVGGRLYGVSQGWGAGVLAINRALLDKAGVTLKPDFDKTWTHQDFLDVLKRVAKQESQGNLDTWGVDYTETWPLWWDFGAEFLDKDKRKSVVNQTPGGSQALQFWSDLTHTHRVQPRRSGGDRPQGVDMWRAGRQAVFGNAGPYILAQWENLDFQPELVLRPVGPKPRYHRWYTDCYAMWSGSKVKDATWEFMAFAGTEGATYVERAGGFDIPGYRPVAETVFLQRNVLNLNKQRWLDAAKEAKQQPLVKPWDEMNAIVSRQRADLLDQKISARDAALNIEREVTALLGG
ncbi:MAG: extracellular solute-binding protein [Chloroflexota bacterium]|nr:extracellular solute-binding protein [Chloroflexota bacterium]